MSKNGENAFVVPTTHECRGFIEPFSFGAINENRSSVVRGAQKVEPTFLAARTFASEGALPDVPQ